MTLSSPFACVGFFLVLSVGLEAVTAVPATTFTHIGARDGLPGQTVWALAQDAEGYMWFGTESGLARFDGLEMTVYHHEPGAPNSLADDSINSLFLDRSGELWVATDGGLCRFAERLNGFDCFGGPSDELMDVDGIAQTRDGRLWIGGNGLKRFDPDSGEVTRFHYVDDQDETSTPHVLNVYVDSRERIWVASFDRGLFLFDTVNERFESVTLGIAQGEEKTFLHDRVRAVHEDRSGAIWVGTDAGLTRLSADSQVEAFYTYNYDDPTDPHSLSDTYVNTLLEDSNGSLWVGTFNGGLNRYDRETDTFQRYQPDRNNPQNPGSEVVYDIMQDDTGLMWFAGRGVDRLDLSSEQLLLHRPPSGDPTEPTALRPEHLLIDSDGVAWLGSRFGLVRYDPEADTWSHHLQVPEHPDWPDNSVSSLATGNDNFRYVGGPQSIWPFLTTRGEFGPSFITVPNTPSVIYEDRSNRLWAGVPFTGIVKYGGAGEPDQTVFAHDPDDPQSLSDEFIYFLYEDSAGRFWVGTSRGFNQLDRENERFKRFLYDAGNPDGPSHHQFTSVAEDRSGDLWLGTGRGINRFNPDSETFLRYTSQDGLPHDQVNAVAVDQFDNVWIGTSSGLSRLDPVAGTFRNLYVENGLPDNQVLRLAIAPDGHLFVGTYEGLVSLNPEEFQYALPEPQVAVTRFEIFNSPVVSDTADESILDSANARQRQFTLTHNDDVIGIEMTVFDYRNPTKNRYAHQLVGIDPGWVYSQGVQRRVSYTTLPAGEYTFRYKGMGISGGWQEDTQTLKLTVLPAPWLTTWAYLLYVAVLFLAVFVFVQVRTRAATLRARNLEATVAERTHELQGQKDTIELQSDRLQQVVVAKDRLYANVSHEFRTPLAVILGPVERLLSREDSPRRRTHLEVIRRNAQRLLRLVEQLMTLARIDTQRTSQSEPLQISKIANTLTQSFRTLAEDKNLALSFFSDGDPWVLCDADSLEKILVNLLSNAIKYTSEGGLIAVSIAMERADWVELIVADSGVGIAQAEQEAVFERFYRTGDQQETAPGSGLGLALVKELAAAINGEVVLSSEPGVGTTVRVSLPRCEPLAEATDTADAAEVESNIADLEVATMDFDNAIENRELEESRLPTVLVIEDNVDLCWHLGEVLGNQLHCEFAHDGEAGLAAAIESVPDIILCDVVLPKLNGFEVTRRIKDDDRTSHIPVIILTARSGEDNRIHGFQSLADDYITKPFSEAELKQRVDTLLSIREILRRRFARESRRLSLDDLPAEIGSRDRRFLERVEKTLEAHYADPDFSMSEFANLVAMSERQLQRKLKALTSSSPGEYIRNHRLEKALELLKAGEPAGSVAFTVGFSSQSYFTSCFKAQYGMTPGQLGRDKLNARQSQGLVPDPLEPGR